MTRILVIEDETILREELVDWLNFEGYEATGAADGIEGVARAQNLQPDLIICDITMPRLDGYGVLLELHANPSTIDIPFIFVTARSALEDIRQGMDLGADDYVTKPFTRAEILQAIQTRLEKKQILLRSQEERLEEWKRAFEYEHEQRLSKAKLVAMFSHDFRNPLATILSASNLLRNYGSRMDDRGRTARFDHIDASVRQLLQMLDDMIFISRIESGSLDFSPQPVPITQFMLEMVNEFRGIYGDSRVIEFQSNFDFPVLSDVRLLRQIGMNLISNAVKYSSQGEPVCVTLEHQPGQVTFIVEDHGIGIPLEEQPDLFNALKRASNVGDVPGTGLGLAIVKQSIDIHQGTIELDSKPDRGTCVRVYLPVKP